MTIRTETRGDVDGGVTPARVADGIELLGEYEDSGYKDPHYVARRADGQTIQLTHLLHLVAEQCNGERTYEEIAPLVAEGYGKGVSADNIRYLVDEKLRPLGVLADANGNSPDLVKGNPLLALRFKFTILPEGAARQATKLFKPLFLPPVILGVLAAFIAMDVWLWGVHGIGQGLRDTLYQPFNVLLILGMVILSAGFHEFGHAAACTYGGAKPGRIGGGLYLVWPAFYTDVTDAYRLNRKGRLRTDLGGVYFNLIFSLGTIGMYAATGYEPLLVLIPIQHIEVIHQLLPFLRMDGYYILADLTGVPDLFNRIGPILRSAVPGSEKDPRVTELKRWVRVVVTGWVFLIAPLLLYLFAMTVISAPRVIATAYDSAGVQIAAVQKAFTGGEALAAVAAVVQLIVLVLPVLGLVYSIYRIATKAVGAGWRWSDGSPAKRTVVVVVTAAAAALTAFTWWPNGEYRPIQKGERFVVQDSANSIRNIGTGRPSLTAEREATLGGAPTLRHQDAGGLVPAAGAEVTTSSTSAPPSTSTTTTDPSSPTTTRPARAATPTTAAQPGARSTSSTTAPSTTTSTSTPTSTSTSTTSTTAPTTTTTGTP